MERPPFQFKQFTVQDKQSAMKLSTDAVLLGAFAEFSDARTVLDIGTGCGILALMAAQKSNAAITAIEPDAGSVTDAQINFGSSPWKNRLILIQKRLQEFTAGHPVKFDHIICNPPFFSRALRSSDPGKNKAKHDDQLSHAALFKCARTLLADSGRFSLILPYSMRSNSDKHASENGFSKTRVLKIFPTSKKPGNRIAMEYQLDVHKPVKEQSVVIRDDHGCYTPEYKLFTKDFYLDF